MSPVFLLAISGLHLVSSIAQPRPDVREGKARIIEQTQAEGPNPRTISGIAPHKGQPPTGGSPESIA